MHFLISDTQINPFYLVGIGFIIGLLGGFFGVGGSFLAGPALFVVVLFFISAFMAWEGWKTSQRRRLRNPSDSVPVVNRKADDSAFDHIAHAIQRIKLR